MELNLTPELVLQLIAQSNERLEKMFMEADKRQRESERLFQEDVAESKRRAKEADRRAEEDSKRFQENLEKQSARFDREQKHAQKIFNKQFSEITDTLGRFAENQVRPAALRLFQKLDIPIHQAGLNMVMYSQDNQYLYEVDILLYNNQFVVPIEVKSTLRNEYIDDHLERMELMRQYPLRGTQGTKIIGAVAAMNADKSVVNYAIKNGLYAIIPNGEGVKLANAPGFKPRIWEID